MLFQRSIKALTALDMLFVSPSVSRNLSALLSCSDALYHRPKSANLLRGKRNTEKLVDCFNCYARYLYAIHCECLSSCRGEKREREGRETSRCIRSDPISRILLKTKSILVFFSLPSSSHPLDWNSKSFHLFSMKLNGCLRKDFLL